MSQRATYLEAWQVRRSDGPGLSLLQLGSGSYEVSVSARCNYTDQSGETTPQRFTLAPDPSDPDPDDTENPANWLSDSTTTIVSRQINPMSATDPSNGNGDSNSTNGNDGQTGDTVNSGADAAVEEAEPAPLDYSPPTPTPQEEITQPEDPDAAAEREAAAVLLSLDLQQAGQPLPPGTPTSLARLDTTQATLADYRLALNSNKIDCATYLANYQCGMHDAPGVPTGEIITVSPGDAIAINSVAFEVVSIDGSGNGTGIVKLPMFGNAKLGVEFQQISVAKGGCVVKGQAVLNSVDVALLSEQQRAKLAQIYKAYNQVLDVADALAPEVAQTINSLSEFIQKLKGEVSRYVGGKADARKMKVNFKAAEKYARTLLADPALSPTTRASLQAAYSAALTTKDFFCSGKPCQDTVGVPGGKGPSGEWEEWETVTTPLCEANKASLLALSESLAKAQSEITCNCSPILSDCGTIRSVLDQIRAANLAKKATLVVEKASADQAQLSNENDWLSAVNGIDIAEKCFKLSVAFRFIDKTGVIKPSQYQETPTGFEWVNEQKVVMLTVDVKGGSGTKALLKEYLAFRGKDIAELAALGEIPASKIKTYRDYIATLPASQRAKWYVELQKHVPYHSQTDNESDLAKPSQMCNVTSLAMNLEALGVYNTEEGQFEDALCVKAGGKPEIYSPTTWITLASEYSCTAEQSERPSNQKSVILPEFKAALESGKSISLSLYPTCKGHIVRVQAVDNTGIWVDDPYGHCPLKCKLYREKDCGKGSYQKYGTSPQGGNNDFYSWVELQQITVKYWVIFSKK